MPEAPEAQGERPLNTLRFTSGQLGPKRDPFNCNNADSALHKYAQFPAVGKWDTNELGVGLVVPNRSESKKIVFDSANPSTCVQRGAVLVDREDAMPDPELPVDLETVRKMLDGEIPAHASWAKYVKDPLTSTKAWRMNNQVRTLRNNQCYSEFYAEHSQLQDPDFKRKKKFRNSEPPTQRKNTRDWATHAEIFGNRRDDGELIPGRPNVKTEDWIDGRAQKIAYLRPESDPRNWFLSSKRHMLDCDERIQHQGKLHETVRTNAMEFNVADPLENVINRRFAGFDASAGNYLQKLLDFKFMSPAPPPKGSRARDRPYHVQSHFVVCPAKIPNRLRTGVHSFAPQFGDPFKVVSGRALSVG